MGLNVLIFGLVDSFNELYTSPAVMVRALPYPHFILAWYQAPVGIYAPHPFAILPIKDVLFNKLPVLRRYIQILWIAGYLPCVKETYYSLGLHPPVFLFDNLIISRLVLIP
jgi:hypothetical protein